MRTIKTIFVHHSVTPRDLDINKSVSSFNRTHGERLHKEENSLGLHVAYHEVASGNGDTRRTRADSEIGFHASNWELNKESLGICLTGNFDEEYPSEKQLKAVKEWILRKCQKYNLGRNDVMFHRDVKGVNKTCPGRNIQKEEFLDFVFGAEIPEKTYPEWADPIFKKAKEKGIKTNLMKNAGEIPIYQLIGVLVKYLK